ncbi:oxidoreductase, partial [Pseudonocardia sp. CNS-139]
TVLLRTSAMDAVAVDPARRVARVGAGALWGDVTDAAARAGLAALAGTARDVGVVGYTLGGGLSWFARSHGLASHHVTAAEVVTADGTLRHVDDGHHADLFWALRGGGGSFAAVTALEFALFPITDVYAGTLFWPIEQAHEVLHAWRAWVPRVPEQVTSLGRLLRLPPLPEVRAPFRGRALVSVELVCRLGDAAADELLAPLRALAPEIDTVRRTPVPELGALHMDPPGPVPAVGDGHLLATLPPDALDAYLSVVGPKAVTSVVSEIRHLGGALRPGRHPGAGAMPGLDGEFAVFSAAITPDAAAAAHARAVLGDLAAALAPWEARTAYPNFVERARPAGELFDETVLRRLREVKRTYDPADVLRANHPVPPIRE